MFDINGSEFLLLVMVALVVVGPERLPRYAGQLGAWARTMRGYLRTAKDRVDVELGDQAADLDWTAFDPRRYDPRRIVRESLLDEPTATFPPLCVATSAAHPAARARSGRREPAAPET